MPIKKTMPDRMKPGGLATRRGVPDLERRELSAAQPAALRPVSSDPFNSVTVDRLALSAASAQASTEGLTNQKLSVFLDDVRAPPKLNLTQRDAAVARSRLDDGARYAANHTLPQTYSAKDFVDGIIKNPDATNPNPKRGDSVKLVRNAEGLRGLKAAGPSAHENHTLNSRDDDRAVARLRRNGARLFALLVCAAASQHQSLTADRLVAESDGVHAEPKYFKMPTHKHAQLGRVTQDRLAATTPAELEAFKLAAARSEASVPAPQHNRTEESRRADPAVLKPRVLERAAFQHLKGDKEPNRTRAQQPTVFKMPTRVPVGSFQTHKVERLRENQAARSAHFKTARGETSIHQQLGPDRTKLNAPSAAPKVSLDIRHAEVPTSALQFGRDPAQQLRQPVRLSNIGKRNASTLPALVNRELAPSKRSERYERSAFAARTARNHTLNTDPIGIE